ncbi:FAD-dependent oxidoreductase [Nocardioides fonticola]|uniref:FAD-dependent oxidoreductase n=1 Tax=Nocardioides fonticola TaxID=450363 RepID=A0ABP7XUQ5_9ACTN
MSDPQHHDFLIVGAGMAAHAAATGIRAEGATGSIAILGAEVDPPVERPQLSKDLWGTDDRDGAGAIRDTAGETGATLHLGDPVVAVDVERRVVRTAAGAEHSYGALLLATGGTPRTIDGLPAGDRVVHFRTLADYRHLRALAEQEPAPRIAVVGAGFIGTEIAAALSGTPATVVLVHPGEQVGDHAFPPAITSQIEQELTRRDVVLRGGAGVERGEVAAGGVVLHLDDGTTLEADAVVVGLGVTPATGFLGDAVTLDDDGGVVIDSHLATSAAHVWAAGDIARYPDPVLGSTRVEHVDNATSMGEAAGRAMAGARDLYDHTPIFWSDIGDLGYEAVGTLSTRLTTVVDAVGDGTVVYYLDDERVRGVLLWNVWDRADEAVKVLAEERPADPEALRGRIG